MSWKKRILIAFGFAAGAFLGFASGFGSMGEDARENLPWHILYAVYWFPILLFSLIIYWTRKSVYVNKNDNEDQY